MAAKPPHRPTRACDLAQLAPWATKSATHGSSARRIALTDVVRNGQPFAFPGVGGRPVILCLLPKVGSTTWKLALLSALHPRRHSWLLQRSPHRKRHVHELPKFTRAQLQRAVRIVLVRNPYDRLLAAYLDKMVLQRKAKLVRRSAALDRGVPDLRLTRSGLLCRDRRRAASSRAAGLKPFWATSRGCSPTRPTSTIGR